MSVLFASLIDATVILALGLAVSAVLRRQSAAVRHGVLTTAIACAALMPVLELAIPQLPMVRWIDSAVVSTGLRFSSEEPAVLAATQTTATSAWPPVTWPMLFAGLWATVALLTLIGLANGLWRLRTLRASCTPVQGGWRALTDSLSRECGVSGRVELLQSNDPTLLVTYGMFRPGIILPAGADDWADDRRCIVLRHELAHIRRRDAPIQVAGELLRVMQPFNPLVWIACRRLRQESEFACDDAVLRAGVEATDYATHLYDVATQLSGRQAVWASAPAIAHPSTLERRIVAMLQQQNSRHPLTRGGWTLVALLAVCVSLPLAAIGIAPQSIPGADNSIAASSTPIKSGVPATKAAPSPQASLSGHVQDQTGGSMPGVAVTVTNQQTQETHRAVTNAPGRFQFPNLAPATYELTAELPGFRKVRRPVDLSAGAPTILTVTMPIGALSEAISVQCASAASSILQVFFPTLSAQEPRSAPIRIGGSIKPPRKTRDVRPVCPAGGVTGEVVVLLEGRIGMDGLITEIKPRTKADAVPAALTESAMDAVRQWEFSPTLLNGQPVEVIITVSVVFKSS